MAAVVLDIRDQRRSELEVDRMRDLANASVEGLLVCDGEAIVSVNTSFATLTGLSASSLVGARLESCFPDQAARARLLSGGNLPVETGLRHRDGSMTPVELILRPIVFAGRPHHVVAVRDLQARKEAEKHIHYLAHHDALTSLPNRNHFNGRIDQEIAALPKGESLAVLCLDLDRFKEINDLFGHAAGDTVLQAVASRVTGLLDERQMMARLGGDEFAILMAGAANPAAASRLAERILEALRPTSDTPETNSISTSIGIALYPGDATDRETLLSHADTALYRAKTEGRNTYRFFEATMGAEVRERRMLEHDLRLAITRDELSLVYQPQKDIRSQAITGFEALLRWKHPERGNISPAVFIPVAEETGAILEIGDWVLKTACREAATWTRPLSVAVNVSAAQLYNPNFVKELHQILLETGLPPRRLEIEITETALVRDFNRALTALRQIKALGIGIAMDDFGTGYSSLSNLRAFPFSKIKIDGSFIKSVNSNEQAATIVRAVLGLGRGLGLPVLAEGVETDAELNSCRTNCCDEVQGYLLGRPADIESLRDLTHGDARSDRAAILLCREQNAPDNAPSRPLLFRRCRDPFRKRRRQRGAVGAEHAAFGDQAGHQPRRRDIEGVVRNRRSFRHDPYRLDPPVGGSPGHGRDLLAAALLDRDLAQPVTDAEIDGRRRQRHIERHAIVVRGERLEISADLVADIAIGGDPVGADDDEIDHPVLHQMAAGVVGNDGMRHAVMAELPRRQ